MPSIRWRICEGMEWLSIRLDAPRNEHHAAIISRDDSRVTVRVMKTDEELMIARHTHHLIRSKRIWPMNTIEDPVTSKPIETPPPSPERLRQLDRYWRAANYLTIDQIYLQDNPLLREPLRAEHIKPRLLGHWGTSPGLSFIYAHLNRLIQDTDANVIYLTGPGYGGPAIVANVYLEGTYSEMYPRISPDLAGLRRLFRQFSTPGGIPSHTSVQTPGSMNEGGELGYVLAHAFGAVLDNPDPIAVAVVGDGEAETGPLEGSWKGVKFLNPVHDGAVLPVLHLNGYKISGPTVLGRDRDDDVQKLLHAHGYDVHFVEGTIPCPCMRRSRRRSTPAMQQSAPSRPRHGQRAFRSGRAGRPSCSAV